MEKDVDVDAVRELNATHDCGEATLPRRFGLHEASKVTRESKVLLDRWSAVRLCIIYVC